MTDRIKARHHHPFEFNSEENAKVLARFLEASNAAIAAVEAVILANTRQMRRPRFVEPIVFSDSTLSALFEEHHERPVR